MMTSFLTPKDVHDLNSRSCEYVILHSKRDFIDVIEDLDMKRLFWIIEVGNHKGPYNSEEDCGDKKLEWV